VNGSGLSVTQTRAGVRWSAIALIVCACGAVSMHAQEQTMTIVADEHLTTAAGTMDVLAAQRAIASLEDRWLPVRFTENSTPTRLAGVGYRIGKFLALDLPEDVIFMDVAHEVFGHGSRLRELGVSGIGYGFDLPPPYGDGGAVTSFSGPIVGATRADLISIDTAGVEAQNVLADHIATEAMVDRTWSYRDAWLYLQLRLAGLQYIEGVSAQSGPGNDVADFIHDFNNGCTPPACTPLTTSTLKQRAWAMLADPVLASAAYGFAIAYIGHGERRAPLPMIPITRTLGYLPTAGFAMAPYGSEWWTDQNFVTAHRLARVTLRMGDAGATHPYGVGVALTHVICCDRFDAGFVVDVWRQPPLDAPPTNSQLNTGALGAAAINVPLGARSGSRKALTGEVGYKSTGFVPGEPLRAGIVARIGLTVDVSR
jgi:hypothetical protein